MVRFGPTIRIDQKPFAPAMLAFFTLALRSSHGRPAAGQGLVHCQRVTPRCAPAHGHDGKWRCLVLSYHHLVRTHCSKQQLAADVREALNQLICLSCHPHHLNKKIIVFRVVEDSTSRTGRRVLRVNPIATSWDERPVSVLINLGSVGRIPHWDQQETKTPK